jgi:hypothetical protein
VCCTAPLGWTADTPERAALRHAQAVLTGVAVRARLCIGDTGEVEAVVGEIRGVLDA